MFNMCYAVIYVTYVIYTVMYCFFGLLAATFPKLSALRLIQRCCLFMDFYGSTTFTLSELNDVTVDMEYDHCLH